MIYDDLDPYAILHTLGWTEATEVTPVHGGSDTAIWQVKREGAVYALRVFGQGQHKDCEREQLVRIVRRVFERGWRNGYEQKGASLSDLRLFYVWAGAVMEGDLALKRTLEDLARIHQWTMRMKKRTECLQMEKDASV